jgi:hypothetical protein
MKTKTLEKGNCILNELKRIQEILLNITSDRAKYYDFTSKSNMYDGAHELDSIIIRSINTKNKNIPMDVVQLNFDNEENFHDISEVRLSEKAVMLLQHLSFAYIDAVVTVLLEEEKNKKTEFENPQ